MGYKNKKGRKCRYRKLYMSIGYLPDNHSISTSEKAIYD
jgi:hypothetical protein